MTLRLMAWYRPWLVLHLERIRDGVHKNPDPGFAKFMLLCAVRAEPLVARD